MSESSHRAPALELSGVTAGYLKDRPPVVAGLSHRFEPGLTQVRGENGSGKSTLVELASGYLRPWAGRVTVGGRDAGDPDARAGRRVCRTQPALHPALTVAEHLGFAARCGRHPEPAAFDRAADYGLLAWRDTPAQELSTGNARRLWLVMCTLGDFDLLVLDEPFNGLDDLAAGRLLEELAAWRASRTVLLVAHQLPPGLQPDHTMWLSPSRHGSVVGALS